MLSKNLDYSIASAMIHTAIGSREKASESPLSSKTESAMEESIVEWTIGRVFPKN